MSSPDWPSSDVLVALDVTEEALTDKLRDHIKGRGLEDVIRVHGGVDQADVAGA